MAGLGLCGTQGKVAPRPSNRVVPLSLGKVRKADVFLRVKVYFAWQALDFVWHSGKSCSNSNRVVPLSMGNFEKVMFCDVSKYISRGVGLSGTQAKVASRLSNVYAARCPWGK